MDEMTIESMVDEQVAAQAGREPHQRRARWAIKADIMCAADGHPGYHDGRCVRCARYEITAPDAPQPSDPRRDALTSEIERIDDAIERDHIATEGAHVSQLRTERRALYAELDALSRSGRAINEPAGEIRSLAD